MSNEYYIIDLETETRYQTNIRRLDLVTMYDIIGCRTIDITSRQIGLYVYDIICDDEGLLKEDIRVSLFRNKEPQLVGTLIFANHDEEGRTIGLTKSQIKNLENTLQNVHYIRDDGLVCWGCNHESKTH